MMEQPTYPATEEEIERKLIALFPEENARSRARELLSRYGTEDWHREVIRVRLAMLRLCYGDLEKLERQVETANTDYRDVLAAAEYPTYSQLPPGIDPISSEAQEAIRLDWEQYLDWVEV